VEWWFRGISKCLRVISSIRHWRNPERLRLHSKEEWVDDQKSKFLNAIVKKLDCAVKFSWKSFVQSGRGE